MVECLEESTRTEILKNIEVNIQGLKLKSNELKRDLVAGIKRSKDMKTAIREIDKFICQSEVLKKEVTNIPVCGIE